MFWVVLGSRVILKHHFESLPGKTFPAHYYRTVSQNLEI
jgi:hypothetical protein